MAAAIPAIAAFAAEGAVQYAIVQIAQSIIINFALGALAYTDANGNRWRALGARAG